MRDVFFILPVVATYLLGHSCIARPIRILEVFLNKKGSIGCALVGMLDGTLEIEGTLYTVIEGI